MVTGFEPLDLLEGLLLLVERLEAGRPGVVNQDTRAVRPGGNPAAWAAVTDVYEVCDRAWRGLGVLPASGLRVRAEYAAFDADRKFPDPGDPAEPASECQAGRVLQGRLRPDRCPAYGTRCPPDTPLGAPMVSTEGACAAYWHAGRANARPPGVIA